LLLLISVVNTSASDCLERMEDSSGCRNVNKSVAKGCDLINSCSLLVTDSTLVSIQRQSVYIVVLVTAAYSSWFCWVSLSAWECHLTMSISGSMTGAVKQESYSTTCRSLAHWHALTSRLSKVQPALHCLASYVGAIFHFLLCHNCVEACSSVLWVLIVWFLQGVSIARYADALS